MSTTSLYAASRGAEAIEAQMIDDVEEARQLLLQDCATEDDRKNIEGVIRELTLLRERLSRQVASLIMRGAGRQNGCDCVECLLHRWVNALADVSIEGFQRRQVRA